MVQKNKKKRGFSLAETAVALAVIAIVSGAAMSMVLSSADIEGSTMLTSYVINDAENVVDCFRYADTVEEFYIVLNKANPSETGGTNSWKKLPDEKVTVNGTEKRKVVFELEQDNYTVTLELTLADVAKTENIPIAETDYLYFSAKNRRGEAIMTEVTFSKQGVMTADEE